MLAGRAEGWATTGRSGSRSASSPVAMVAARRLRPWASVVTNPAFGASRSSNGARRYGMRRSAPERCWPHLSLSPAGGTKSVPAGHGAGTGTGFPDRSWRLAWTARCPSPLSTAPKMTITGERPRRPVNATVSPRPCWTRRGGPARSRDDPEDDMTTTSFPLSTGAPHHVAGTIRWMAQRGCCWRSSRCRRPGGRLHAGAGPLPGGVLRRVRLLDAFPPGQLPHQGLR